VEGTSEDHDNGDREVTGIDTPVGGTEPSTIAAKRVDLYSAILTVVTTVITFGLAITAVPNAGAGCRVHCVGYPYLDTLSEFPSDYLWMPPAMILVVAYVVLVASIHAQASPQKWVYGQIGLSFALLSAVVLLGDYFVQFSVVPISLMNGQTEGIALLTQYNPYGVFIVLEELGYLLMSLSFVFLAPVFAHQGRLASAVQWVFVAGFVLTTAILVVISVYYGLERIDRFEIAAISIDWLVLVVNGILLSVLFRRRLKQSRGAYARDNGDRDERGEGVP
jgi:hypothetical protein